MIGQSANNFVGFIEGVLEQLGLNMIILHGFSQNESFLMQLQNWKFYACIKQKTKTLKELLKAISQNAVNEDDTGHDFNWKSKFNLGMIQKWNLF